MILRRTRGDHAECLCLGSAGEDPGVGASRSASCDRIRREPTRLTEVKAKGTGAQSPPALWDPHAPEPVSRSWLVPCHAWARPTLVTGWHCLHFGRGRRAEDGPGSQQEGVFFLLFTPLHGWLVFCSVLFIDDKCSLSPRRSRSHMHRSIGQVKGEERDKKTGL